jgi:DNA-directed RNA polymerase specialized sigma24 family protein
MIRLRAIEGLNIADTARQLSISVAAAKARYYRAVHRLSRVLGRQTRKPLRPAVKLSQQPVAAGSS